MNIIRAQKRILLSQSFIKAMNHGRTIDELELRDDPKCPAKARAIYLDGMYSKPSQAMNYGNFLETLLWGSTDSGEVATISRKANRPQEKTIAQVRIEQQAYLFRHRWSKELDMDIHQLRPHITVGLGERYAFKARMDFYTSLRDGETVYPRVIMDLKLTENLYTMYGPFPWGNVQNMDHTQAVAYSWAYFQKHKEWVPFYYFVISHRKVGEYVKVKVVVDSLRLNEFKTAMRRTVDLIDNYSSTGKWPKVPSDGNCRLCPLQDRCDQYRAGGRTITVY